MQWEDPEGQDGEGGGKGSGSKEVGLWSQTYSDLNLASPTYLFYDIREVNFSVLQFIYG